MLTSRRGTEAQSSGYGSAMGPKVAAFETLTAPRKHRPGRAGAAHADHLPSLTPQFLLRQLLEAYDLAGVGLCIVDGEGRLLQGNSIAVTILEQSDGLELNGARILRTRQGNASSGRGLLEFMREPEMQKGSCDGDVAIRPVLRPSGKRPLTVLAQRMDGGSAAARAALIFLVDPELPMQGMESHVRGICGFTAAETDLVMLLMQGKSLAECCHEMGIRRSTAASHLRQLFNKTEARTQSQLVSVLYRRFGLLNTLAKVSECPEAAGAISGKAMSTRKSVSARDEGQAGYSAFSFVRR